MVGASNHALEQRHEHDYYATDPVAARLLMQAEKLQRVILEPACGGGHLAEEFKKAGHQVLATDLHWRGYGTSGIDFLTHKSPVSSDTDIVTNPPYKYAQEFVERALDLVAEGSKVCMFLKLQFLEGQKRKAFFEANPPARVHVSSKRIRCALGGDFEQYAKRGGTAIAYAWYVWEKGYKGETVIKWL